MKKFLISLQLSLALWIHVHVTDPRKPGKIRGLAGDIVKVRTVQALAANPRMCAVIGDSRFMQFEVQVNADSRCVNLSIAGSTAAQWRIIWSLALACSPRVIVDDSAGNDFLGGAEVSTVLANKLAQRAETIKAGIRFLCWEVCYLGAGAFPDVNPKLVEYNRRLAEAIGPDFIPVNDILSDLGVMKAKYDSGDHIHHSLAAWDDCYGPRLRSRLDAIEAGA